MIGEVNVTQADHFLKQNQFERRISYYLKVVKSSKVVKRSKVLVS